MSFLASDVMDESAAILNDSAKNMYTYAAQLPYLIKANEELEQMLLSSGVPVQRSKSATITVTTGALTLTLPSDFLLPRELYERAAGSSDPWVIMTEKVEEPKEAVATNILQYWTFRNNGIYFVGATTDRDVLLTYDRKLAVITGQNSAEDFYLSKVWLAARTAELCARYVGMNATIADGIADKDVARAEDSLIRIFVLNGQGTSFRRGRFRTQRLQVY